MNHFAFVVLREWVRFETVIEILLGFDEFQILL